MKKFVTILIIFNLGFSLPPSKTKFVQDTGSIFVNWNRATFSSLERQYNSTKELDLKNLYDNRILALESYLGVEKGNYINKNSIRFNFLSAVEKDMKNKNIIILEANESGEKVIIQNYVVKLKSPAQVDIDKYYYYPDLNWIKVDSIKNVVSSPNLNLTECFVKFAKGFNYDDIIITHLDSNMIKSSEYFLFGTLIDNGYKSLLFKRQF